MSSNTQYHVYDHETHEENFNTEATENEESFEFDSDVSVDEELVVEFEPDEPEEYEEPVVHEYDNKKDPVNYEEKAAEELLAQKAQEKVKPVQKPHSNTMTAEEVARKEKAIRWHRGGRR